MTIPVAHAGHWLPYLVPAFVVLVGVVVSTVRERRHRAEAEAAGEGDAGESG